MGFSPAEVKAGAIRFIERFMSTAGDDIGTMVADTDRDLWQNGGTNDPAAWDGWIASLWAEKGLPSKWVGGDSFEVRVGADQTVIVSNVSCQNTPWPDGFTPVGSDYPYTELSSFEEFKSRLDDFSDQLMAGTKSGGLHDFLEEVRSRDI
ncbi:hypothetical protein ITJ38_17915 [Agreia pratensis]|uniref:hypothetical protein n=1 Tax=Agreia pratensis TaxID=150121 RepID=UPI00188B5171|nr:hypothetical protein [Agreia pratensis]MBF4636292.1 hypothetical protein [Agreia pratensis]